MTVNMNTLYDDLMHLCSMDETFYYKDIRFHSIHYRIFNYRLCSYATFQCRLVSLNCRGTMFNITNPKKIQLVSLASEKFFNYDEGFSRQQFHQRGKFGDQMEKMDGTLISTFLHHITSKEQLLRLKSKQSLTSKQVIEATQLLTGDFQSEIDQLVRLNYTVNMEYTSPSNHVVVSYPEARLTILSIRSHNDGQTLFGSRLKIFLLENHFFTIVNHLVSYQTLSSNVTHQQLLEDIHRELHGEGYVVEIIQPDQSSYLVKIKTQKYLLLHRDGENPNSLRSLFEAIINEHADDLRGLFQDDFDTLKRIDDVEQHVRPIYNRMIELVEQFYRANKHLSKKDFVRLISMTTNINIYSSLLMNLYAGEENDYKRFAMKHAKDLFGINNNEYQSTTTTTTMRSSD